MKTKTILDEVVGCEIEISDKQSFGVFANSFRIVPDTQNECYLDFLIYSATNKKAKVLSRIRVRNDFLLTIQKRLNTVLSPDPEGGVHIEDGQVHINGSPVYFMSSVESEGNQ